MSRTMYDRARFHLVGTDGTETARDLLLALLDDRGHPFIKEILIALDDLGLEVVER